MLGAACGGSPSRKGSTSSRVSAFGHTGKPCSTPATFAAASVAMPSRVQREAEPRCGTITTLSSSARPCAIAGSASYTSSAALKCRCVRQCRTSAASSMSAPRLAFTRIAPCFMRASCAAPIMWRVVSSRTAWMLTTSAAPSSSSSEVGAAARDGRLAVGLEEGGLVGRVPLERFVDVRVVIHDVRLVALHHHPGEGRPYAAGADHPHRTAV